MKHGEWSMKCLSPCLQSLVSPLVMILRYQVAYVRLGNCEGGRERGFSGDWGGTEGIGELILLSSSSSSSSLLLLYMCSNLLDPGNVVQRLQNEIADLPDPSDPQQVYTPFFRFLRMHI